MTTFLTCPLVFKFRVIDQVSEPPVVPTIRGTLVHNILQNLLGLVDASKKTKETALTILEQRVNELFGSEEFEMLNLDDSGKEKFKKDVVSLVLNYFNMEDPKETQPIGIELRLEAELNGVKLIGIIDRLDNTEEGLVIVDYKTGRAPRDEYISFSQIGVNFYALLIKASFNTLPSEVKLMYLKDRVILTQAIENQKVSAAKSKIEALWNAIVKAYETDNFRPRRGIACNNCYFKKYCPLFGGEPESVKQELSAGVI